MANESALSTQRARVPMEMVVRPFRREAIRHAFAKPKELLAERAPADALPCREAIGATDHDIQQ